MTMLRLSIWLLLAWPLPALVAGASGWHGIWGSGSALVDYLIPIPVAGGALHVPSFVLGALALLLAPGASRTALSRVRGLALCVAVAGALLLFELPSGRMSGNPLALFLLCDGVLALLLLSLFGRQWGFRLEPVSLLLTLGPVAGVAGWLWIATPATQPFNPGLGAVDGSGSRRHLFVHTTRGPDGEHFRAQALAWAERHQHPWLSKAVEDVALHFASQASVAHIGHAAGVFATLCLYEDGTPPRWLPGHGDCFRDHLNFDERVRRAARRLPDTVPPDEARERGLRQACAEAPPAPAAPASAWVSRVWRCEGVVPAGR